MKHAVEAANGSGLKWTEGDNVTDLDFANDIVLIDETSEQLQKLTNSAAKRRKGNWTRHKCAEDEMHENKSIRS